MKDEIAIVLAAGKGKRMNSNIPKVLCEVLFKPMIGWVIEACEKFKFKKICVVTGHKTIDIEKYIKNRATVIQQPEQKGTANAVKCTKKLLEQNINSNVFICCGDSPLIDMETICSALEIHKKNKAAATVVTAKIKKPNGYGRIIRLDGNFVKIVEETEATKEEKQITEINSGAYWFKIKDLLTVIDKIEAVNSQKEQYLTDAIYFLFKDKKKVSTYTTTNSNIVLGANTRLDLFKLNEICRKAIIKNLIENNVKFQTTDGVIISPNSKIGAETEILPGTIIKNNSIIGKNCVIGPNTIIENSNIGDNCIINASQIYSSKVNDEVTIGPFCHIRPNSTIDQKVKIGNFVEVKNSNLGAGTAISHLTYVGDSDVGKNVNFGCGVVTTNFDGVKKNRCKIKDGAFIGCNTNLIAPVKIGKNSYTGAGSTITKDVPDEALGIERVEQKNIDNFSKKKLAGRKLKFED